MPIGGVWIHRVFPVRVNERRQLPRDQINTGRKMFPCTQAAFLPTVPSLNGIDLPCPHPVRVAVAGRLAATYDSHMKAIGRFMQLIGLIVLPLSMFLEITGGLDRSIGLSEMVIMLVFGIAIFGAGRMVEGYSR
ncbi:MAG: hypothetical protein KDA62_07175 [Planctomycetales bacterium]|nr:hypothetical protein [Planctomycetales bacterium]